MKKSISIISISLSLLSCGDSHAAEQETSEPMTEENICQLAWEQNEAQMEPEDRLGNPFAMRTADDADWQFEMEHEGHRLLMIPARSVTYQVELESSVLDCEVPVSWKVLDSRLEVGFDPQFRNKRQITMINGKPFGSETKGGLYLRHQLLPSDPHDINLAWFLNAPALKKAEVIKALRTRLHVPKEQPIEVLLATDLLKRKGAMGIQAVAMSVGQDPFQHWALLPNEASQLWPDLRFLPSGPATAEASLEQAWNKAKILDLATFKLWDVNQGKLVDCAALGSTQRLSCRQVVDDAFVKIFKAAQEKNADTCIHLAWSGAEFSPYFVSTFCVEPNGSVRALGSKAVMNPGFSMPPAQER